MNQTNTSKRIPTQINEFRGDYAFLSNFYPAPVSYMGQDLIIGYVKDGIMYEGEVFDELSGKYSFSPDEKGEYFFYLLSGSSDYLSLKSGNLEVN